MSCIHFKFSNTVENDKLKFEGLHISVADLRDAIINLKKLKANLYTLKIIDAQTKKEYSDGKEMLPRNSSVIVSRVPLLNNARVPKSKFKEPSLPQSESTFTVFNSTRTTSLGPSGLSSEKGMLSSEELMKTADLANANATEEAKVQAMMRQSADLYAPSQYVWTPRGASGGAGAGSSNAGFHPGLKNPPPHTYICFRCGNRGHWIQMCPTNGDPNFNHYRYKRPIGTPTSQMISVDENVTGAMLDRNGQLVVRAVDLRAVRDKQIRKQKQQQASDRELPKDNKPPPELVCKICEELIKDAVIIPCCKENYCYECIQIHLCENEFTCPACKKENMSPENLVPNKALRRSARNFQVKAAEDKSVAMASTTGFVKKTPVSIITHPPVSVSVSKPAPAPVSNTSEMVEAEQQLDSATNVQLKAADDKNIVKAPIGAISPKQMAVDESRSPQMSQVSDKVEEQQEKEKINSSGGSAVVSSQEPGMSPVKASSSAGSELGKREEDRAKERRMAVEEMVAGGPVLTKGEPDREAMAVKADVMAAPMVAPMAATVAMPGRPAVPLSSVLPLTTPNMLGQSLYQPRQLLPGTGTGILTGQVGLLAGQMPPSQVRLTVPARSTITSGDPSKFDKLAAELLLNSAVSQKRASSPLCLEEFYLQQKLLKLFSKTGGRRRSTSSQSRSRSHSTGSYSRSSSSDSNNSFIRNSWSCSSSSSASSVYSRSRSPIHGRNKATTVVASSRRSRKNRQERSKRMERSRDQGEKERKQKGHGERKERQVKEIQREEREGRGGGSGERVGRSKGERSKRHRRSHRKGQNESLSPREKETRLELSSNQQQKQHRHRHHRKHRSGSACKSERKKKKMMLKAEELLDVGVNSPLAGGSQGANTSPPILSDTDSLSNLSVKEEEVLLGHRLKHKKRKKKQKRHQRSRHVSDDARKEIMNDGGGETTMKAGSKVEDGVGEVEVKAEWSTIPVEKGQEATIEMIGAEEGSASIDVEPEFGNHGSASRRSSVSHSSGGNCLSLGVKGEKEEGYGNEEEKKITSSDNANLPNCIDSPSKSKWNQVFPESGMETGDKSGTKDKDMTSISDDREKLTSPSPICPEGESKVDGGGGVGVEVHGGDCEDVGDVEEAVEIDLHADEVNSLMASMGGIAMEEGNRNSPKEEEKEKEQAKTSTPLPTPSSSPPPLNQSDLATILDQIDPIEDWRSLGLELRVPARKLSHIQHKFPVESLEQVLLYWITSKENCSWKYLVAALRKIREGGVASRISKKFISRGGVLGKEEGELSDSDEGIKKSNKDADLRDTLSSMRKDEPDLRETINSQKNVVTRKRKPVEENVDSAITSPQKRPKKSTVKVISIASSMFSARRGQDYSGSEESIFTADDSSSSGEEEEDITTKKSKSSSTMKHVSSLTPEKHSKPHEKYDRSHDKHNRSHDKHNRSHDKYNQLHIKNDQAHDKLDKYHRSQSGEGGKEKKRRKEKKHRHQPSTSKSHKSKKGDRLEREEKKKKYKKHKKSSSGHAERPHRSHHRVH